jgi:outer membrane usher protein
MLGLCTATLSQAFGAQTGNPVAKAIRLDLPVKYNGGYLCDATVELSGDGEPRVETQALFRCLAKVLSEPALARLRQQIPGVAAGGDGGVTEVAKRKDEQAQSTLLTRLLSRDENPAKQQVSLQAPLPEASGTEFLALEAWGRRGLRIAYNSEASELSVSPSVDDLKHTDIRVGSTDARTGPATVEAPAFASAFVTTRMAADYVHRDSLGREGLTMPSFAFDSAVRIGSVVLENEAYLAPEARFAAGSLNDTYGFTRRGTRLVYDWPDEVLRFKAGDLMPATPGLVAPPALLGVSVEKSYAQLRPGQSLQPTASQALRIERSSNVDLIVDGAVIRRLRLAPGQYTLRDLPIASGFTKFTLAIEDDTGERRTVEFDAASSASLLAPSVDEWSFHAGVKTNVQAVRPIWELSQVAYTDRSYAFDQPIISAAYRTGLTQNTTGGVAVYADATSAAGTLSLQTQTRMGFVSVDFGGSVSPYGTGVAARAIFDAHLPKRDNGLPHALLFTADFATDHFGVSEGAKPKNGSAISVSYTRALTERLTASLSGSFDWDTRVVGPRWDTGLAVSNRFTDTLSGALTLSYGDGERGYALGVPCVCDNWFDANGFRAIARLNWRPDASSYASLEAQSSGRTVRVAGGQSGGSGLGAWSASVDAGFDGRGSTADVNAAATYAGNRADVSVSHAIRTGIPLAGGRQAAALDERSSLRAETSFVMADGAWGIGRPVRNGFAIVEAHDSLEGRTVSVGAKGAEIARSDLAGPAVINEIAPFVPRSIPYDAADLSAGYDLGSGTFEVRSPYKAGYRLKAGSAYTVTAMGTLLDRNGAPLTLMQGTASEGTDGKGRTADIFSNKTGRFGAQGLAPGRWIIEMATEPEPTRYVIDIPENAVGLHDAGTLKPS